MITASQTYAAWALGLTLDDVPASARHAAKRHILDGVGCWLAGVRSKEVPYASAFTSDGAAGADPSTRAGALATAFEMGVQMHALDFDDTHADALVHATSVVLPAVAAAGSLVGASGAQQLAAAITGYEMICRLGAAVRHGFHERGFHATSVCGTFAAALAASRLLRSNADITANAIGIAGSFASGSLEFLATGSSTKQIHPGWAAQAGLMAALLAADGADGPASILEGEHGLFRAYTGTDVPTADLIDGLTTRWEVERITIKPYPACQLSHASLDALRAAEVPAGADVAAIVFDVPADAVPIVCEPRVTKLEPRTAYEAKFSLPYCAAALLHDGSLGIDAFTPDAIARPAVLDIASKVTHRSVDPGVAAANAPGRAEVTLADGTVLVGEVKTSRGGPDDPLTDEELIDKFVGNGGTPEQARRILALEEETSLSMVFV